MDSRQLNRALLQLERRAENVNPETLVQTFVDAGTLIPLLSSRDHQVIQGRRGTGKTHALIYLAQSAMKRGDIPIYVDMRHIGSTGGLYADSSIPFAERATRLLADTLCAVHDELMKYAVRTDALDLSQAGPILDRLITAAVEVVVIGEVQTESSEAGELTTKASSDVSIAANYSAPSGGLTVKDETSTKASHTVKVASSGITRHRVHFGAVGRALQELMEMLAPKRIWLLVDEWSVVPIDLQPYLADLLRRSVMPVRGITVKLGVIEQRTSLKLAGDKNDYIGIELGADMAADLNLDDFMVFDNNEKRATQFFKKLLCSHYTLAVKETTGEAPTVDADEFIRQGFTQINAFDELVRAAEGVPRDALNIIALCAQKAVDNPISVGHVRAAAKTWYTRDKEAAVTANITAKALLDWIVDEVIAHRRARAFLVKAGISDPLIDALFDARVLHVLKRSVSAHDEPGVRYDVYKIDYGCYVDLLTTVRTPRGLLPVGDADSDSTEFLNVPPDDYRAIRRAILDIGAFERRTLH